MTTWQVALWGLGVVLAMMTAMWVWSFRIEDVSLVDRVWGMAFVVLAWVWGVLGDGLLERRVLLVALVTIWGVRLSAFITWRNRGHGEDKRYAAMRRRDPDGFPVKSLFTIFWFQGALAWIIAGTFFYPMVRADSGLNWLDAVGVVVWAVGVYFEAVGDWQLARFLADESNRGKVMDRGLWRYTRHPNYFGDITMWTGLYLVALASGAWWAFYGTLTMGLFIYFVSGVKLTDKVMSSSSSKREGYDEYVARTNAFFPGPPRRA